jgi:hypothetical protein
MTPDAESKRPESSGPLYAAACAEIGGIIQNPPGIDRAPAIPSRVSKALVFFRRDFPFAWRRFELHAGRV